MCCCFVYFWFEQLLVRNRGLIYFYWRARGQNVARISESMIQRAHSSHSSGASGGSAESSQFPTWFILYWTDQHVSGVTGRRGSAELWRAAVLGWLAHCTSRHRRPRVHGPSQTEKPPMGLVSCCPGARCEGSWHLACSFGFLLNPHRFWISWWLEEGFSLASVYKMSWYRACSLGHRARPSD